MNARIVINEGFLVLEEQVSQAIPCTAEDALPPQVAGLPLRHGIVLYWHENRQVFVAEVPELPGCVAEGATYRDALSRIQSEMRSWIRSAAQRGQAIPVPQGRPKTA